jgi:hypothetical protein
MKTKTPPAKTKAVAKPTQLAPKQKSVHEMTEQELREAFAKKYPPLGTLADLGLTMEDLEEIM